jgi:formylglycine-generating enzyme required for sulfatase activity
MLSRNRFTYSVKKAWDKHGLKVNRGVKHLALAVLSLIAFQCWGAPGEAQGPAKGYTETVTTKSGEKVSFKMVLIPGGTFLMGSPEGEPGRKDDEGPQHKVRIDQFYLCTTETTIELFLAYYYETVSAKKDFTEVEEAKKEAEQVANDVDAMTGPTPVYGDMTMGYGKTHPAIGMTWHNAMNFCEWLSRKTGRKYRLPTEAEWEYACRAGATNVFGFGNDPNQLAEFAWYKTNSDGETHEVGKKKTNVWGLYDMLGNVSEWVYDFYSPQAYKDAANNSPATNLRGPTAGKVHVARGGDYTSPIEDMRCAARTFEEEGWRSGDPQIPKSKWWLPGMDFIGFRAAMSIDPNAGKPNDGQK